MVLIDSGLVTEKQVLYLTCNIKYPTVASRLNDARKRPGVIQLEQRIVTDRELSQP